MEILQILVFGLLSVIFGVIGTVLLMLLFRCLHVKTLHIKTYLIQRKIKMRLKEIEEEK